MFSLLHASSVVNCITLGDKEHEILSNLLDEFRSHPAHPRYNCVIYSGMKKIPKVFIWCPKQHLNIDIFCPLHKTPLVFHCWTSNVKADSFRQPRLVYDLHGNIVFVQAIYRCPTGDGSSSHHEYHSSSAEILAILPPEAAQQFPVKLFYRSACSQDLLDYLIVHIGRGHNFLELAEDIASLHFRAFSHQNPSLNENEYYNNVIYSSPSNDQLMHVFLGYFNSVKSTFENELATTSCSILTCDHTFKVSKHIGVSRTADKAFVKQFKNLFVGLNENGQVVNWRLTRSTAFGEIEDLLTELKYKLDGQLKVLEMIVVDDCCSVRPSYQKIFTDVPVKLDIFHACQRFVKTLPKAFHLRKTLASEFGLIFRHNRDTGEVRKMPTPCTEDIQSNLEMFLQKWQKQLSEATIDSIDKLRSHISRGCCSDIPPGIGTQKNERLHKLLKKLLLGGASVISPELAIAVLSLVLYIWSSKRNPSARKHSSNAKINPVVPVELKQSHLLSGPDLPKSVPYKFKSSSIPTDVPSAMKCRTPSKCKTFSCGSLGSEVEINDIEQLCNENVVNYVLQRTLHINDVCSSIGSKCKTRDTDITDFPFTDIERFVKVLHSRSDKSFEAQLSMDMNQECLEKNLLSFDLQRDDVPGDGNCCFASIAKVVNKFASNEGNVNVELIKHLTSLGLCKSA